MEPRERLVNRLARASGAAERASLLADAEALVDAETVATLRRTAGDAQQLGAEEMRRNLELAADEVHRLLTSKEGSNR
jgi:hypothetical protein